MGRIQEIEQRKLAIKEEIRAKGESITDEEIEKYEKETKSLNEELRTLVEANEKRKSALDRIAAGLEPAQSRGGQSFPDGGGKDGGSGPSNPYDTMEYRKAFMDYVTRGKPIGAEFRADQVTFTTDIPVLIPVFIVNKIVEKLESYGTVLSAVTKTSYRGGVKIPVSTVKPVAVWVAEGQGSPAQNKPVSYIEFTYKKLRCKVGVTFEVDTLSLEIFEQTVIKNISDAIIKALEVSVIKGSGTGEPKGILTETPVTDQVITIPSGGVTYFTLLSAEGALPVAYEPNAKWFMSKKTFVTFQGITDTSGQPILRQGVDANGKFTRYILGREVILSDIITPFTGSTAAGTPVAFIFNPEDYVLNISNQYTIKRYEDNETDDIMLKAIVSADGKVVDVNSLVVIKTAAA